MRLYLDDIRDPPPEYDIVVRSYDEAVAYITQHGCPTHVSFDHDLGDGPSGYELAKWMVEQDMDGNISIPIDFTFRVHSANPVGALNIESYLNNYMLHKHDKS